MSGHLLPAISAMLVNNIVLTGFLGVCPFLGTSRRMGTATGMALAVVFVMTVAGAVTWMLQRYLLIPLEIEYLRTIAFVLVIASLVQLVEIVMRRTAPALHRSLGIFLPLITTNCAVLGVAIINVQQMHDFAGTLVFSFASALGFGLALVLFAGLRERIAMAAVPRPLGDTAVALITAGLMALAFSGFQGLL